MWFAVVSEFSTINLAAVVSITPMASPTQKNTNKPLAGGSIICLKKDPHIYKSDLQLMGGSKEFSIIVPPQKKGSP